jgi:hypothetical protein
MNKKSNSIMSFYLSDVARGYFEKIGIGKNKGKSKSGIFGTLIQPYYLCMQMGMIKNKRREPDLMSKDMIDYWASYTNEYQDLISGVGFYYYCEQNGILEEDERTLRLMDSFFSKEREKIYTKDGYEMLNKFAQGGFDYILEKYGEANDLADFLIWYMEQIET